MTSHNAAVNFIPSLAVFMDWLHLMAVSLWIGGLFYISVVLLHSLKGSETLQRPPQLFSTYEKKMQHELQVDRAKTQDSRNKISPTTYYLALVENPRWSKTVYAPVFSSFIVRFDKHIIPQYSIIYVWHILNC